MISVASLPATSTSRSSRSWVSAAAALSVGVIYFALSFLVDPGGFLGTDTGGKEATVEAMSQRGDWRPDIGYWAQDSDPTGRLHPYFGTRKTDVGWVNVSTLPMILVARPLYDVAGARSLYVLPAVGAVFAALGTGALALRFGAKSSLPALLLAGLASPVLIYALDFWEHSIGLALMTWGLVWTVDSLEVTDSQKSTPLVWITLAGAAFGVGATMRSEALVYGLVAGLAVLSWPGPSRLRSRILRGAVMIVAAGTILAGNALLEQAVVGSTARITRSAGAVSGAGSGGFLQRGSEAIVTLASPLNLVHPVSVALAVLTATALIWVTRAVLNSTNLQRPLALVGVCVVFVALRTATIGPSFIPGLLAASPVAAAGLAAAIHTRQRLVLFLALGPLPIAWWFQYEGAASAQWGGRYILTSGVVLLAYACASLTGSAPKLLAGFAAANVLISGLGVAFVVTRSHTFADASRWLANRPEQVLVFSDSFLAREAGSIGTGQQWLAVEDPSELELLPTVLGSSGVVEATPGEVEGRFSRIGWVSFAGQAVPEIAGYTAVATEEVPIGLGLEINLTTFESGIDG